MNFSMVILDFHCAYMDKSIPLHGRIYITDVFVLFYCKIFGREKKIAIPFIFINKIIPPTSKNRGIIVETGILDSVKKYVIRFIIYYPISILAERNYCFCYFWEPEKSYHFLHISYDKWKNGPEKSAVETAAESTLLIVDAGSKDKLYF
jgi:hypothetical protein